MFAQIRNLGLGGRTCLDSPARKKDLKKAVGLYPCHNQGGNQVNKENLMNRSRCSEGYRPSAKKKKKKPNVKIELQTKPMPKIYKNITHQKETSKSKMHDHSFVFSSPFFVFACPFVITFITLLYCFVSFDTNTYINALGAQEAKSKKKKNVILNFDVLFYR